MRPRQHTKLAILGGAALFLGGCGAPKAGEACSEEGQGFCEGGKPTLICRNRVWTEKPADEHCTCMLPEGVSTIGCAVPGFVGIARVRRPGAAVRLRRA
ncbi:MAG: hypothetical protein ACK4N5_23590 [Myxococcales bacterium]